MEDSIEMYLDDLNASKVWQLPNKLCLCGRSMAFLYETIRGRLILISMLLSKFKRKTQIKEADYNIAWTVSPETVNANLRVSIQWTMR